MRRREKESRRKINRAEGDPRRGRAGQFREKRGRDRQRRLPRANPPWGNSNKVCCHYRRRERPCRRCTERKTWQKKFLAFKEEPQCDLQRQRNFIHSFLGSFLFRSSPFVDTSDISYLLVFSRFSALVVLVASFSVPSYLLSLSCLFSLSPPAQQSHADNVPLKAKWQCLESDDAIAQFAAKEKKQQS